MSRRSSLEPNPIMRDDRFVACSPEEDRTRQEFREDADVNVILKRHGVNVAGMLRPVQYGSYDFDQSLHTALLSLQAFRDAFSSLPEGLRKAYPSPDALAAAVARGEDIQASLDAEILSASGGAAPSDSAADPQADPSA